MQKNIREKLDAFCLLGRRLNLFSGSKLTRQQAGPVNYLCSRTYSRRIFCSLNHNIIASEWFNWVTVTRFLSFDTVDMGNSRPTTTLFLPVWTNRPLIALMISWVGKKSLQEGTEPVNLRWASSSIDPYTVSQGDTKRCSAFLCITSWHSVISWHARARSFETVAIRFVLAVKSH